MILTARIAKTGVIRLRNHIRELTGSKILVTSRIRDLRGRKLHFRYGFSLPLPLNMAEQETEFNRPEEINFLKNKRAVANWLNYNGFLAPIFRNDAPEDKDFPLIIRETLDSYGGRGMHVAHTMEEFDQIWESLPGWWWCSYIPTISEFRFHIGNSMTEGVKILRAMKKVPRTSEIEKRDVHIRHVKEYHYSKRSKPYEQLPKWCTELHKIARILPGWLYSLDVGITPEKNLVIFEANTASGIDNGCARDYAPFIIKELGLGE